MAGPTTPKGSSTRTGPQMSDAAKYLSMAMLGIIALAVISIIILFCGVAAVSGIDGLTQDRSDLVAFTWAIVIMYTVLLIVITGVVLLGWKKPHIARRMYLALIILLAILIAWMGVEADKSTAFERRPLLPGNADTRAGVWSAGLIMCAITALLLLLGLLALEAMGGGRHADADSVHHVGEAVPVGGTAVQRVTSPSPRNIHVGSHGSPAPGGGVGVPVQTDIPTPPPPAGPQPVVLSGGQPQTAGTQPQGTGVQGAVVHHNQAFGTSPEGNKEQAVI